MKKLYIIGGTMGVGKSSVCQKMKKDLPNSVFLDGDWCWDSNPFQVTDETKAMVLDNIVYLLNNFIGCTAYENIIFCWVMHEQGIINEILSKLDIEDCNVKCISLLANKENLAKRLMKDIESGIRSIDVLERSFARLPLYDSLDTIKIDTNQKYIHEIATQIEDL